MINSEFQLNKLSTTTYRIDINHFWQRQTSVYLVISDRITLIDSGHCHPTSTIPLRRALAQLNLAVKDISQIIYTHSHIDHVGGGLTLPTVYGIEHFAHPGAASHLADYDAFSRDLVNRFRKFINRTGSQSFPEHVKNILRQFVEYNLPTVSNNIARITPIRNHDEIPIGRNRYLSVHHTPGHTPWDLSLYDPEDDFFFIGDLMSAQGNTMLAEVMDSDLDDHINSLHYALDLGPNAALPAHGNIIHNPEALFQKAIRIAVSREEKILDCIHQKGKTICEISRAISKNATASSLIFIRYLGMTATHLNRLVKAGKIKEEEFGSTSIYLQG